MHRQSKLETLSWEKSAQKFISKTLGAEIESDQFPCPPFKFRTSKDFYEWIFGFDAQTQGKVCFTLEA